MSPPPPPPPQKKKKKKKKIKGVRFSGSTVIIIWSFVKYYVVCMWVFFKMKQSSTP